MDAPDIAKPFLEHWRGLRDPQRVARLEGGDLKDVYRVDADDAAYALRVYTADVSAEDVTSELTLVASFAERLSEVPDAVPTDTGDLYAALAGRVAVLTAFVEGERAQRADPAHRSAAATMLAKLHRVAAAIEHPPTRAGYPAWRHLDWRENRWWSWPAIEHYLAQRLDELEIDGRRLRDRLAAELDALPDTFATLVARGLPEMPLHNDYCPRNLIMRDGRVAALIDWDECMVDWRALEVANAACEFAIGGDGSDVDATLVRAFLRQYVEAGGELLDAEREAMPALRRMRLLWETLYEISWDIRGAAHDWPYIWWNLTSLDGLDERAFLA